MPLILQNILDSNLYHLLGLPLLIFFARVFDVTLGTLRIIFISRGKKKIAPLLGFVEVFIWIVAVSQIMKSVSSLPAYLGYAAGFAAGNYVGMVIEDRLAIGTLIIRTILPEHPAELIQRLHDANFGVTCVAGEGAHGPVTLLYTVIKRKSLPEVTAIIHSLYPRAFLTIEELRSAEQGIFPKDPDPFQNPFALRKAK